MRNDERDGDRLLLIHRVRNLRPGAEVEICPDGVTILRPAGLSYTVFHVMVDGHKAGSYSIAGHAVKVALQIAAKL